MTALLSSLSAPSPLSTQHTSGQNFAVVRSLSYKLLRELTQSSLSVLLNGKPVHCVIPVAREAPRLVVVDRNSVDVAGLSEQTRRELYASTQTRARTTETHAMSNICSLQLDWH